MAPSRQRPQPRTINPTKILSPSKPLKPSQPVISTNLNAYSRTDPLKAFSTLLKLFASLPRCAYKLSQPEHALSLHLLSIIEPFISLAPSKRTLLPSQPTEILDAIVFHIDDRSDLLALAGTCRRMHDIIFPRHWEYRKIRCKITSLRVFHHLSINRSLASNVRTLEILDARSALPEILPRCIGGVTDTDLESTDEEMRGLPYEKQERYLVKALGRMCGLRKFAWGVGGKNRSPMPVMPPGMGTVWEVIGGFGTLRELEVCDALVFSRSGDEEEEEGEKKANELLLLTEMTSVTFRSTSSTYGSPKHPELSRISAMLSQCPNLKNLNISYTPPRSSSSSPPAAPALPITSQPRPQADSLLLTSHFSTLTSLTLSQIRCTTTPLSTFLSSHTQIHTLHLDIGPGAQWTDLTLPDGTLPNLKEINAPREILNAILGCPVEGGRKVEVLKGFKLAGMGKSLGKSDVAFLRNLRTSGVMDSVKRVELTAWGDMTDIKVLVDALPGIMHLDVGKRVGAGAGGGKGGGGGGGPVTNMVEWATLLSDLPELVAFHGVRFFYEVSSFSSSSASSHHHTHHASTSNDRSTTIGAGASIADRSRIKKNDEIAGVLAWKCPKLRKVDHWEEGTGRVIVILREKAGGGGEEGPGALKARWDVRRVKQ